VRSEDVTDTSSARKYLRYLLAVLIGAALCIAVLTLALLFLPPCSAPACAKKRFDVSVEVDRLRGIDGFRRTVQFGETTEDILAALSDAGIVVVTREETIDLYQDTVTVGDLFALRRHYESRTHIEPNHAAIYALLVPRISGTDIPDPYGILFDYDIGNAERDDRDGVFDDSPREAFAVAADAIRTRFAALNEARVHAWRSRTFVHELLHALNRTHADAVRTGSGGITLEAPTACLVKTNEGGSASQIVPLLGVSPSSVIHFQHAAADAVLPGRGRSPLSSWKVLGDDCADLERVSDAALTHSASTYVKERIRNWFASGPNPKKDNHTSSVSAPLRLHLDALDGAYPTGYPIYIGARLENVSDVPVQVSRHALDATAGSVTFHISPESGASRTWRPVYRAEAGPPELVTLAPGDAISQNIAIFFGSDGWTFPRAGQYVLQAALDDDYRLTSSVAISVEAPTTDVDRGALEVMQSAGEALFNDIGLFQVFQGRIHLPVARDALLKMTTRYPESALAQAALLSLGKGKANPPLVPEAGVRGPPEPNEAAALLGEVCSDAILSSEADQPTVLQVEAGRSLKPPKVPETSKVLPVARIAFCTNQHRLDRATASRVRTFFERMTSLQSAHLYIVGHTDRRGTCAFNDALSVRRASTASRVARQAGFSDESMTALGVGSRRPIDFAASTSAYAKNRRVDILATVSKEEEDRLRQLINTNDIPLHTCDR
jgi:outer membrane protein OmpA-like peptidoglycan-associated protein